MREVIIPITVSKAANADIDLPGGVILDQIVSAVKFVGSDGTVAAVYSTLTVDTKGDGNASGAGAIKLQADGKKVRHGSAMGTRECLILTALEVGEVLRP